MRGFAFSYGGVSADICLAGAAKIFPVVGFNNRLGSDDRPRRRVGCRRGVRGSRGVGRMRWQRRRRWVSRRRGVGRMGWQGLRCGVGGGRGVGRIGWRRRCGGRRGGCWRGDRRGHGGDGGDGSGGDGGGEVDGRRRGGGWLGRYGRRVGGAGRKHCGQYQDGKGNPAD